MDAGQKDNLFHVGYGWWGGLGVRSTGQLISNLDSFLIFLLEYQCVQLDSLAEEVNRASGLGDDSG